MSSPSRSPQGANHVDGTALRRTLQLLRPHLAGSGALAAGGVCALLLEVVARLLEPWPVKWVIDGVIPAALGRQLDDGLTRLLIGAALAVVVVAALRAATAYLSTVAFALAGSRVTTHLRAHVHRRLLAAHPSFHDRARAGDLVTRVVSDVGRVQEAGVTAGLPLAANTLTVVGMLIVVLLLDPILALAVVAVLPLMLLSGRRAGAKITHASRRQRRREGQLAGDAGEAFAAVRTVQAYGLASHLGAKFAQANVKGLTEGVLAKRLSAGLERRTDLLVGLATGAVLALGGRRVVDGAISPGELVVFLTYLKTTFKPLRDLAKYTGRIARAAASGERVADALDAAAPERDAADAYPLPPARGRGVGRVEVRHLTVAYHDLPPVLYDADLTLRAGEVVAVTGPSGSGKSTLIQVLLRFLTPSSGEVRLDGHPLDAVTVASLREAVAVVLQDSVLFAGTLADNVRLGRLEASDDEVEAALRAADLGDLVDGDPDGIHRVIAERGTTLSGGQRQRVAVARALLRDPRLVLLDEPTTGLDAASSREVTDALVRLFSGRTTLLVTHDPALLARADRVVEIRDHAFAEVARVP